MSFLKGSVTFQRFRIAGQKPSLFNDAHLDRLRERPAKSNPVGDASGIQSGWAAGTHVLDTDFGLEKNVYPDHLLFDFWTQTDKLPTDRLKAYYEADLKAISRGNKSGFPSAKQKREAKGSARDRLVFEAKDGRWRKWKCIPVAWDALRNIGFFGASGVSAVDRFTGLWDKTFVANTVQSGLAGSLTPLDAATLAMAIKPEAKDVALSEFVKGLLPDDRPAWCKAEGYPTFLGNEFLLWLWYYVEVVSGTLKLADETEVVFFFSGGIKVADPRGQTGDGTMNSGSAIRLPEAKAAIRSGKLPRKAALTLVRNTEQFSFILQAETLAVSGAKLPPADKGDNPRAREVERLQHVRDLAETIDLMYATFLGRRLSSYWAQELQEMQGWLKGGKVAKA